MKNKTITNSRLVSVIMPAYNGERYIGKAIESVLKQTYSDIELIIVEDASTDKTLDVIKRYSDERISLFVNEENQGIAFSTNRAISNAKGSYVALLDDDDEFFPDKIKKQVEFMESHPEIDILGGRTEIVTEDGTHLTYGPVPHNNPKYIKAMLLFHCMDFRNGTALIRKAFIDKNNLKYRDKMLGMQDYLFYIESSKIGTISTNDELCLKARQHDNNETLRRMRDDKDRRASLYGKLQDYSLKQSGFVLSPKQINAINRLLPETELKSKMHKDDLNELKMIMIEILKQGKEMEIDFYDELTIVCKKELFRVMKYMDIYDWI